MKEILLTKGYVALVDDRDYEELSQYKWSASVRTTRVYAVRAGPPDEDGKRKGIYMHRQILMLSSGEQADHIDHDGINNQRANLRICTNAQNSANRRKRSGSSSRFKGVSWHAREMKWIVTIRVGQFDDENEAAKAYNDAACAVFGEHAALNDV